MRHMHALVEAGVYLIENPTLEELVRDRLGSFCVILLATKYRGATGCPVRPIAAASAGGQAAGRRCRAIAVRECLASVEVNSSTVLQANIGPAEPPMPDLISTLRA
jgi:hypothetical protein